MSGIILPHNENPMEVPEATRDELLRHVGRMGAEIIGLRGENGRLWREVMAREWVIIGIAIRDFSDNAAADRWEAESDAAQAEYQRKRDEAHRRDTFYGYDDGER